MNNSKLYRSITFLCNFSNTPMLSQIIHHRASNNMYGMAIYFANSFTITEDSSAIIIPIEESIRVNFNIQDKYIIVNIPKHIQQSIHGYNVHQIIFHTTQHQHFFNIQLDIEINK